eukprot:4204520-Pleurochrysis_carterae.AAC.1
MPQLEVLLVQPVVEVFSLDVVVQVGSDKRLVELGAWRVRVQGVGAHKLELRQRRKPLRRLKHLAHQTAARGVTVQHQARHAAIVRGASCHIIAVVLADNPVFAVFR